MPQMMFVLEQVSLVQKIFIRGKKDSEQESLNNFAVYCENSLFFSIVDMKKKKKIHIKCHWQ